MSIFLRYFSKDFRLCYALGKIPQADTATSFSTSFAVDSALMLIRGFHQISRVILCSLRVCFGELLYCVMSRCILPRSSSVMLFEAHPERYFQPVCWSLHGLFVIFLWASQRPVHCLKLPLVCSWSVIGRFLGSKKTTIRLMVF